MNKKNFMRLLAITLTIYNSGYINAMDSNNRDQWEAMKAYNLGVSLVDYRNIKANLSHNERMEWVAQEEEAKNNWLSQNRANEKTQKDQDSENLEFIKKEYPEAYKSYVADVLGHILPVNHVNEKAHPTDSQTVDPEVYLKKNPWLKDLIRDNFNGSVSQALQYWSTLSGNEKAYMDQYLDELERKFRKEYPYWKEPIQQSSDDMKSSKQVSPQVSISVHTNAHNIVNNNTTIINGHAIEPDDYLRKNPWLKDVVDSNFGGSVHKALQHWNNLGEKEKEEMDLLLGNLESIFRQDNPYWQEPK